MAPLSYKIHLALALSTLLSGSNAAPYLRNTSATIGSVDWATKDLPVSDSFSFFSTGAENQSIVYYNSQEHNTYNSSSSTSSTPIVVGSSSSPSARTAASFAPRLQWNSTSAYTVPTYFPASSYSGQASVLSSILSGENPSISSDLSTALDSALNNPHVYFTTSVDASTITTESEGTQLTYTETYHHLLGLEPGYVSVTAGAGNATTTISESPVVHTITDKASTRTINEGTHTHTIYEKPVTHTVTDAPVIRTVYEKPVIKTVVHMVYRTEKPHIRYIIRRIHRHHHDHHDHDHRAESTDSVPRTTSTLAPSPASN